MVKNHLSRLVAPKSWYMERKKTKWMTRPMAGPHSLNGSFTLTFLLRDILKYAKTSKEISTILYQNNILVDGIIRKNKKFPVGFMDVIEIAKLKEYYRIIYDKKGNFSVIPINKDESSVKLLKIIRKNTVKKGKIQITFHDGRNFLTDKFDGNVGDTVLFDLKKKIINKIINLEKGSLIYLSGGSHIGIFGKVKDVIKTKDLQKPKVVVEIGDKEYITLREYAFVVGKDKPEIMLEAKQ